MNRKTDILHYPEKKELVATENFDSDTLTLTCQFKHRHNEADCGKQDPESRAECGSKYVSAVLFLDKYAPSPYTA